MLSLKFLLTFTVFVVAAEESSHTNNINLGASNTTGKVNVPAATPLTVTVAAEPPAVAVPKNSSNTTVSTIQPKVTEPSKTTVPPISKSASKETTLPLTTASPHATVPVKNVKASNSTVTKPSTVKPSTSTVPPPVTHLSTASPSETKDMTSGGTYDGGTDVDERGKGTKINHVPREVSVINGTAASKLVQQSDSFSPLSAVGMIAGLFVSVVVVGYLSLTLTKYVQRRRRGNLQLLVNEEDMDVTDEDLRHFEASCIHIDTET